MKLSLVIPAHNEEGCIQATVENLHRELAQENIQHEILVINDNSSDQTESILQDLSLRIPELRYVNNDPPNGFGFAVRKGLDSFRGDAVCIYMADASDSPTDVIRFFRKLEEGYDCVFGTRWSRGGKVYDYPIHKYFINRMANKFIQVVFGTRYNDTTNAFKMYRSFVIEKLRPFLSHHFNLTVELPLKAMIRGFNFAVLPNSWSNRATGISKLRIREMGSRYLFIVIYCFIEKWLSRGDYKVSYSEKQELKNQIL